MKRLKLLAALLLLTTATFAQNVKFLSIPQKNKDNNAYSSVGGSLIGKIDNKLYFTQTKSNNLGRITEKRFMLYDANTMKVLDTKVFNDIKDNKLYDGNIYQIINGQLFSISHNIPEGKGKGEVSVDFKLIKYNKETLVPESEKDFMTYSRPRPKIINDPMKVACDISPNSEYFVFSIMNMESGNYALGVIDKNLNVLWTAEGNYKPKSHNWSYPSAAINNKGEVVILVDQEDFDKSRFLSECIAYDSKGGLVGITNISPKGKLIHRTRIAVGNNDEFFIAGTTIGKYESDKYSAATGCFYTILNSDLKGMKDVFIEEFAPNKKGKYTALLNLSRAYPNKEGGMVLVLENWSWIELSNGSTHNSFYNNTIVNMGPKGTKMFTLYKAIGYSPGCDAVGAMIFFKNNKLYFVYNENHENFDNMNGDKLNDRVCQDTDMILATCDVDAGTYEKKVLASRLSKDFFFIDYPSRIEDDKNVYFQSYVMASQGEGGFGKLTFE